MLEKQNKLHYHLFLPMLMTIFISVAVMADDDLLATPSEQGSDIKNRIQHDTPFKDAQTFVSQETIKNMQQQIMYHLKHFLSESKYTAFLLVLLLSTASLAWLLRFEWERSVKWINRLLLFGMLILYYSREYFQQDWQDFISDSLLAMILLVIVLEVYFAFSDDRPLKGVLSAIIGMVMMIGIFDMFHLSLWF